MGTILTGIAGCLICLGAVCVLLAKRLGWREAIADLQQAEEELIEADIRRAAPEWKSDDAWQNFKARYPELFEEEYERKL